jgi:hypothetical protein
MSAQKPAADSVSQSDNRAYRIMGFVLLFLIIATIVFVFVKTLVFDQPINDQALKQALVAASVGVTLSCLIAWVLDLLQVIELRPGWSKLLWGVLVTSILASSAMVYKQFVQADAMDVACVRPVAIDESSGKFTDPIAIINQERHKKGGVFGFVVTLRNVPTDPNGDYSMDIRWEFDEGNNAAFGESAYSGNAKKLRADPARLKRLEQYKTAMPECVEADMVELLVRSNLQPTDGRDGAHQLNITVYDNATGRFARTTLPTTIIE